jgi:hypothetical protein
MAFGSISVDRIVDSEGSVFSPSSVSFRNRIINGDMRIDQRNAGASVTINTAAHTYTLDRWRSFGQATDGVFTVQQSTTAPSGFTNSVLVTVTTADASIGSTQLYTIQQPIEGLNIADLAWGTASAKAITVSFQVRSSVTGTFSGSIKNSDGTRSYPFTYAISSANTFETKFITIPGDTTGTWLTTNGIGMSLTFTFGSGSNRLGTANTWAAANYDGATGSVALISTLNATWYITGVQLEVGSVATPFERRPFGTELALCQRYYYRITLTATAQDFGNGFNVDSVTARVLIPFPTTMRTNPSAVEQTGTASDYRVRTGTVTVCSEVPSLQGATPNASSLFFKVASGLTGGQGCMGGTAVTTGAYLAWSAEL